MSGAAVGRSRVAGREVSHYALFIERSWLPFRCVAPFNEFGFVVLERRAREVFDATRVASLIVEVDFPSDDLASRFGDLYEPPRRDAPFDRWFWLGSLVPGLRARVRRVGPAPEVP